MWFGQRNSGDEIERWHEQHAAVLVVFAASILGDRNKAEDAVQQVFLKLLQNPKPLTDVRPYLFSAVRNVALNMLRSESRTVALDESEAWFDDAGSRDVLAEKTLRTALWAMPEEQRAVVVMHIWGELTFAEIAQILKTNANTVASRYRYAIERLRTDMSGKENVYAR